MTDAVRAVHGVWAWIVIGSNAVAGLWALGAHWLPWLRHRSLWWWTAAAEVAIVVQAVLGTVLVQGMASPPQFHLFYGFVAVITVAIIYSYRQQLAPQRYLLYGLGGLFLMGLGLRAVQVLP